MKRAIIVFLIIFFSGALATNIIIKSEQQYSYLAKSFLQGKVYFTQVPGTLEDLVYFHDKYYWHEGPFPALTLMPFIVVGNLLHFFFFQGYLQIFLTLGIFILCYKIARLYSYSSSDSLYLGFAFCFASIYQLIAFIPWVWYFVQAITVLFLFFALYEFLTKRRYVLIGTFMACAIASRFTAGFGIVFFIFAILKENISIKKKRKYIFQFLLPIFICGILLLVYNYVRFGDIFNNGFLLSNNFNLSTKDRYEMLTQGLFKLSNIPTNVYYYFLKSLDPVLVNFKSLWGNTYILQAPFVTVRYPGTSIFIVSPIFLWVFRTSFKNKIVRYSWSSIIAVIIPLMLYYWPGWRQVGPRYLLDCLPFAYLLLIHAFREKKLTNLAKLTILISALFDLYLLCTVMRATILA